MMDAGFHGANVIDLKASFHLILRIICGLNVTQISSKDSVTLKSSYKKIAHTDVISRTEREK